ncbi:MAG: GTP pyrophosphokinase [Clostridia bacterium]|jgi:(p)ppGpp synthase/HD superfamily hydrolase|nr:GTP pyrophosphokinase [Clostridia bacterium]MCI1999211.1 GTP pyrophosphokinase [Clostridia bacterium]MCI2014836.1 GTP pyrophosphokinase [Clostridia bacterium]
MLYSEKIKKALLIAYSAHAGQFDKGGYPYVFHPYHLAEQMDTEDETVTAILHDVCEDTDITFDYLKKEGFSEEVICALKLLTREENMDYIEYVKRLASNDIARKVKISDLIHNMDESRVAFKTDKDRIKKYKMALDMLL